MSRLEITLTYVVVNIWDQRRLIVPMTYFSGKAIPELDSHDRRAARDGGNLCGLQRADGTAARTPDGDPERFKAVGSTGRCTAGHRHT